jgi:peptidyl-prolyl cis-trans isomerase D
MALINKINEKSGVIAGVIAVALILFMLGGDIMSNNSIFNFGKDRIGKINGENISLPEYQYVLGNQEREYEILREQSVGENERPSIEYQAWNELVAKFAYKPEYDKLGITVTSEELVDMVQGKFIHSQIMSAFGGEQGFDKNNVINFLQNFDKVQPNIQERWKLIEKKLPEIRVKEKYINLLKKTEYVTKEEAKRVYSEQNDKAELKFVFVPYTTIEDSTIKVTDDQLEEYISKNKDKYKVEAGRSIDYVIFNFTPSGDDSATVKREVGDLAVSFKLAENDSLFVSSNSDAPSEPKWMGMGELPEGLKTGSLAKDSVYGPSLSNGKYGIFKVMDSKNDSISSLRASHILFRTDVDKDAAKKQANEVLAQIKGGASFEDMARQYGTDGTKDRGGDLGWFSNNHQMVKPFEDACFKFNGKGLLPNLVETQFGYHIIKITEPKTNKKYLIASVEKEITAMDATKDMLYAKASKFVEVAKDTQSFNAAVKNDPTLERRSSPYTDKSARSLTGLNNAREIVKWAFNEASVGSVSTVFTMDNQYVVAIVTAEREEGTASVDDVRNEVTIKVKNELKGDKIIEKLKPLSGDFAKIAADYGTQALTGTATDVTLASTSISSIGYDPVASGRAFGLKAGEKTTPFKGETGVVMLELVKITPAPEVADYNQFKTQKETQRSGAADSNVDEAIKKLADVKDNRYKFY